MGIKGYKHPGKKHAVVAVNPDGTVAGFFEYIKDAVEKYGMDRHSITDSCKRGTICRGLRWWYEEDFRDIYMSQDLDKLKYTLDPNRDRLTYHFKKGHKAGNGWHKLTEEQKLKIKHAVGKTAKRLNEDGTKNFGRFLDKRKPIKCITTGQKFNSIKECSAYTDIAANQICMAAKRGGTTHGMRFQYVGA